MLSWVAAVSDEIIHPVSGEQVLSTGVGNCGSVGAVNLRKILAEVGNLLRNHGPCFAMLK
jgi:hypothetical protein